MLPELTGKLNAAGSALRGLVTTRGRSGSSVKMSVIRSLFGDIQQARLRGVSYAEIAKTISLAMEIKITAGTLRNYVVAFEKEDEEAAKRICREAAAAKLAKK